MANSSRLHDHTPQGQARYMPVTAFTGREPEGAIVQGPQADADTIAVVYAKGDVPPKITVSQMASNLQMVLADGVAVAIVSNTYDRRIEAEDVLLVERFVTAS